MAPFHPLRHEARVLAARALSSAAVFCAIAVVLLGGSAGGPLTNAEAKQGDTAIATVPPADTQVPDPAAPVDPAVPVDPVPVDAVPPVDPPVDPVPPVDPAPPVDPPVDPVPPTEPTDPSVPPDPAPPAEEPNAPGEPGGGGDKEEPVDPEAPEAPPTEPAPQPGEDPGEAPPSDGGTAGRPGGGETDSPGLSGGAGKPPAEEVEADPGTGLAGGDAQPEDPIEAPAGDGGDPNDDSGTGSEGPGLPLVDSPLIPESGAGGVNGGVFGTERPIGNTNGGDGGSLGVDVGDGTGTGAILGATATPVALTPASLAPTGSGDDGGGSGGQGDGEFVNGDTNQIVPFGEPVFGDLAGFVSFVPDWIIIALIALAALSLLLGLGYLLSALRNRRLTRQRGELLQEVGLLQTALLPPVPERVGALRTSVAYRPADGPGAGGDFYDVLPLAGGRVGFILGDVSGHGRGALARTAFMRYTLRAYLEAGLEPRVALQVAGRVIDENLGGDFATVLLAVHDPETGSLDVRERRASVADRRRPAAARARHGGLLAAHRRRRAHRAAPDDGAAGARRGRVDVHGRADGGPHGGRHPRTRSAAGAARRTRARRHRRGAH